MQRKTVIQLATLGMILTAAQMSKAQGVSVTQYDEATSAYEEAYVNGTLNAGKSRTDGQTGYDLDLGAQYDQVFSSPDRDLRLQADGNLSVSRSVPMVPSVTVGTTTAPGPPLITIFSPPVRRHSGTAASVCKAMMPTTTASTAALSVPVTAG